MAAPTFSASELTIKV